MYLDLFHLPHLEGLALGQFEFSCAAVLSIEERFYNLGA